MNRLGPYGPDTKALITQIKVESQARNQMSVKCDAIVAWAETDSDALGPYTRELQLQVTQWVIFDRTPYFFHFPKSFDITKDSFNQACDIIVMLAALMPGSSTGWTVSNLE